MVHSTSGNPFVCNGPEASTNIVTLLRIVAGVCLAPSATVWKAGASAVERGGSRYKLPGPGHPEGGPELDYVAYVFVFLDSVIICRLYKFIPSPSHSATERQSSRFSVNIYSRSALAGGEIFFTGARARSWRPWLALRDIIHKRYYRSLILKKCVYMQDILCNVTKRIT
jgi:hypothetical protein